MINDQKQLMEKLTAECKSLTQKLEDTSLKHKYKQNYFILNMFMFYLHVYENEQNLRVH